MSSMFTVCEGGLQRCKLLCEEFEAVYQYRSNHVRTRARWRQGSVILLNNLICLRIGFSSSTWLHFHPKASPKQATKCLKATHICNARTKVVDEASISLMHTCLAPTRQTLVKQHLILSKYSRVDALPLVLTFLDMLSHLSTLTRYQSVKLRHIGRDFVKLNRLFLNYKQDIAYENGGQYFGLARQAPSHSDSHFQCSLCCLRFRDDRHKKGRRQRSYRF